MLTPNEHLIAEGIMNNLHNLTSYFVLIGELQLTPRDRELFTASMLGALSELATSEIWERAMQAAQESLSERRQARRLAQAKTVSVPV